MRKAVIISGARTPFGKFGGGLKDLSAAQLGGIAIRAAIDRADLKGDEIDEVIMGTVLQGGQGQIPSRQAAREADLPWNVKTETINKVCASGLRSVTLANQLIRLGDEEVIVAGGMESMSQAPYILPDARWGHRMGDKKIIDMMIHDGLTCSFTGYHMGTYGNQTAQEFNLTRQAQDEWAYRSHKLALEAMKSGKFAEEIVPVEVPVRRGEPMIIDQDEAPREDTNIDVLGKLPPVFGSDGTITAGNAPGVNDGAGALIVMSEDKAKALGKEPIAKIVAQAEVAVEAKDFPQTPGLVIHKLLEKTNQTIDDIDLFEINEAFAAVALASSEIAKVDQEKININGGAVALGHPIGASGVRIILTLMYELKRQGGGLGIAAICSGGGQGDAIMIEVPKQT